MKIYKFNESVNNWTSNELKKFIKEHEQIQNILGLYLEEKVDMDAEIEYFYFDARERFRIQYKIEDEDDNIIEVEYDTVVNFINSKLKIHFLTINELFDHCIKYKHLTEYIVDYLRWKIDDYEDENENSYHDISFFFDGNVIQYSDDDIDNNDYNVEDYDEMVEFLNNPEFVKNYRKYNL